MSATHDDSERRAEYNAVPETMEIPLTVDEAYAVASSNGHLIKDSYARHHFSRRALIALNTYVDQVRRLTYAVESRSSSSRGGNIGSLDPWQAAQFLTDSQRAALLQQHQKATYERVTEVKQQAEATAKEAAKLHARTKLALQRVLEAPDVDAVTKNRLLAEIERLEATEEAHKQEAARIQGLADELDPRYADADIRVADAAKAENSFGDIFAGAEETEKVEEAEVKEDSDSIGDIFGGSQ